MKNGEKSQLVGGFNVSFVVVNENRFIGAYAVFLAEYHIYSVVRLCDFHLIGDNAAVNIF